MVEDLADRLIVLFAVCCVSLLGLLVLARIFLAPVTKRLDRIAGLLEERGRRSP